MSIQDHYKKLLLKYGDTAESAQYSDRPTQERRFEILSEIAPLANQKILDFGCGTGHFASYLKHRNIPVDYTGVDIVEEFFDYGRKKLPEHRFGLLSEFEDESFDYAFVSVVFNNKMDDNVQFYQDCLCDLFPRVKKGIAFNMMSTYVDYQDEGLFYESPEIVFQFVKEQLTPLVNLRYDYRIKSGVVPFEFAIYAYK